MEYYMDEKWKISKDDKSNTNNSGYKSSSTSSSSCSMSRSASTRNPFKSKSSASSSGLPRSSSQKCSDFSRKCKEQKAKFYIVKRCISMLVNWKKNGSDS